MQTRQIALDDARDEVGGEGCLDRSGASGDHGLRHQGRDLLRQRSDQLVDKGSLPGRDEQAAADGLEEQDDRRRGGDVFRLHARLRDDDGDLEAEAKPHARESLVSDPLRGGRVDAESVDEPGANGREHGGHEHQGDVVAEDGDEAAGEDAEERDANDEGQIADAAFGGRDTAHDLEVDGQVVEEREEAAGEEDDVDGADEDHAFLEETALEEGAFALEILIDAEEGEEEDEAYKRADDA